jgi:hypothetical protein
MPCRASLPTCERLAAMERDSYEALDTIVRAAHGVEPLFE